MDVDRYTQQTIYGLHTEDEYEVHVRCRMLGFTNFGDFSDSVFVYVPGGSSKGKMSGSEIMDKGQSLFT